ncbi:MAG: glycosyltransferase family 1 protein [Verrucomicrobiota bacterium]
MKLIVNGSFLSKPHVGMGMHTLRLIKGLKRQYPELDFSVVLPQDLKFNIAQDIHFIYSPASSLKHPLLNTIHQSLIITQYCKKNYPEAIFHSPFPMWSLWQPQKTIVTLHDCLYQIYPEYMGKRGLRKLYLTGTESYAAKSNRVLTVSQHSAQQIAIHTPIQQKKLKVVYNWIPENFDDVTDEETNLVRKKYQLPEEFWLYMGGYDFRKNVDMLIKAYATVAQKKNCPPLVLAGKLPDEKSPLYCHPMTTAKHCHIDDKSLLNPGFIHDKDIASLYKAARLVIYPSLYEGFGLPILEASSVETPVIASHSSSIPEIIENRNCLFDPLSVDDLILKLAKAADHPESFLNPLKDKFTEKKCLKQYLDILKDVDDNHS